MMTTFKSTLKVLLALSLLGGAAVTVAEEKVPNYTTDGSGAVIMNSGGECWRTSSRDTTDRKEECGYPAPMVEKVMVEEVVVAKPVVVTQEVVAAPTAATLTTTVDEMITIDAAVLFGFDSAELSDDGKAVIDERIATYGGRVERTPETKVIGHTDSTGPEAYNQALSERRAQAVADYLESQRRVPDPDIEVVGMGESNPVADNSTREGRALNRRVDILFEGVITK